MDKWIRDAINSVTSGLTALVNSVVERISWVYTVVITFLIKVRTAFDAALAAIRAKLAALLNLANEIYTTTYWLIVVRIPQAVGNAVNSATNYVMQQVNNLGLFLRGVIDGAVSWILRQIDRIDAFIEQVITWAASRLNELHDTLTRIATIVGNLLLDPRRLAAWVIDAIVVEFLHWLDRNADRIALILRNRSVQLTMQAAIRIEDMIARLL